MTALFANALSMGLLSWGWFKLSTSIGIMTWVGFMGCTGYYASGNRFIKGWRKTVITNMSGVFWAMVAIQVAKILPIPGSIAIMTGVISFFIVAQAKISFLAFIPGTFIGCASTFGMNGNWQATIIGLLMGSVLGIASDYGGVLIEKLAHKKPIKPKKTMSKAS